MLKPSTYLLETFGCQMNVLDSQLVEGQLRYLGLRPAGSEKDADLILFNTCSVRQHAEDKVLSRLGRLKALKRRRPEAQVVALYRDLRTYGPREDLYQAAREEGVLFARYALEDKPVVTSRDGGLSLAFTDPILGRPLNLELDLLVLAAAIESHQDQKLAQMFRVPLDGDGWFLEAHQKLRPVDFANDGIFLCGMAHYPKPLEESIAQAQAAAARAATVLARGSIKVSGLVSRITSELCCGCQICVNVCPYQAISFDEARGVAMVNEALCKGCGACAAACPCEAPMLMGFNNRQMYAQIKTALSF